MKRAILTLLAGILFLGCGSGIKSGWGNFTAYYNTYYNAKKSYNAGVDKVLSSKINFNPQQPIRIHEVPINVGAQDFDKAIEKGAEILRKHGDSKWVDNSLNLIGKSYYFKKEYFSADQKFQELSLTSDDRSLVQESIIWRSRVLLEMELYGQGIQYINEQLNDEEAAWNKKKKAELKIILAQYHVVQNNWDDAIPLLNEALPELSEKKYKERGYFLLGQLYEKKENFREAYKSFSTVENFYFDYDLQYLALRKTAETARLLGDNKAALDTFTKMVRDDKNTEFKAELDYEIAKTYQEQKEYRKAEEVYKSVLNNKIDRPAAETMALSYFGLAEVYRYGYNDFEMAAAYYDTSSRQNASAEKLPDSYNASELAISFGNYSSLKNELDYRDSLLWVSNLSTTELDSLIAEIKKRKLEEIQEARRTQEQQQNTLVNVSNSQEAENTGSGNGFLNVNSPSQQNNARTQFFAIWGNRPLADNWRVEELINASGPSQQSDEEGSEVVQQAQSVTRIETSIDLSEVPFEPEQKEETKKQIAGLKYQLGNLFFISLEMPDSAAIYFKDVIENHPNTEEVAVSYYSLSEIQNSFGMETEAKQNAEELIQKFPTSRYAYRLAEKYNIEHNSISDSTQLSVVEKHQILKNDTSITKNNYAKLSTELALENSKNIKAAAILFDATQSYIELAKQGVVYSQNYEKWVQAKKDWKIEKESFKEKQKIAVEALNDSSLTDSEKINFENLIDSTLSEPSFKDTFPYYGEYWDKARINIDLFSSNFKNSELAKPMRALKQELQKPVEAEPLTTQNPEAEVPSEVVNQNNMSCTEYEPDLQVRGGLEAFMAKADIETSAIDEIVYLLKINQRGILEGFRLITDVKDEELVSSFNKVIENELVFSPVLIEGEAIEVNCEFSFPVSN